MQTRKMLRLVIIAYMVISPAISKAQFNDPDDVLDNPVPFDGGITLLLAAGVGYGLKKANEKKKVCKLLKN